MLDVHWYDEWGCLVSNDAALLWVLALGQAKQINSQTLTLTQLRRVAPADMTDESFFRCVEELSGCDSPPISGDDRAIVLHGFDQWNSTSMESKSGVYGNHIRWHVNARKHDPTCDYCLATPVVAPDSPPDIAPRSLSEQSNTYKKHSPKEYDLEFLECWEIYPRKDRKPESEEGYLARRNQGVSHATLLTATRHFAEQMDHEERIKKHIMLGSTFFGPHNRWEDFVEPPKIEVPRDAGRVTHSRRDIALGDIQAYRDTDQDALADELQEQVDNGDFD